MKLPKLINNKDMSELNTEQIAQLSSYLAQKWRGRPCQMCGSGNWSIQNTCFELKSFRSSYLKGETLLPVIPVICTNCSNTLFINAVLSGVVDAVPQESFELKNAT